MKPATRVLDVTTNMTGERIGMTIDDSALAHIMSVLTDLYSDPELACIREYATNALDAHIQAGITRPIEVFLPSPLSPYFKVRDYGEGLDKTDIEEIYSRYGTSTKRESNDVVGMLGLGCKSALTYTDQFTLTAVKNGKMIQVSISRDEDGSGSMTILDERDSDIESGVEILIPAKMHNSFKSKADSFFSYWEKGTVLVNGAEPKRVDGVWLSDNLLLTNEIQDSVVVMGNVPYRFLDGHSQGHGAYASFKVVAFVNIGEVHFTPSRESLQATKVTQATLTSLNERVRKEKNVKFQEMIDEAPNRADAFAEYHKVKAMGYDGNPEYKGERIPLQWTPPIKPTVAGKPSYYKEYEYTLITVSRFKSTYRRSKNWSSQGSLTHEPGTIFWVNGYNSDKFTPYKREKLDQWAAKHTIPQSIKSFVFVPTLPEGVKEWVEPSLIVNWGDIEAEKIVREKNAILDDGRPTGSYKGWVAGVANQAIIAGDIDITKEIFWHHGNNNTYYMPEEFKLIKERHPDATLILLGGNRIEKFKRDFPTSQQSYVYLNDLGSKWTKDLTEDDKLALYVAKNNNSSEFRMLKILDEKLVDDPKLVAAIKAVKSTAKRGAELLLELNVLSRYGASMGKVNWENPIDKYELLTQLSLYGSLSGVIKKHLYLYVNAAFAAEKEGA